MISTPTRKLPSRSTRAKQTIIDHSDSSEFSDSDDVSVAQSSSGEFSDSDSDSDASTSSSELDNYENLSGTKRKDSPTVLKQRQMNQRKLTTKNKQLF